MNLATFERAQVAAFAYREARYTGSIECIKAICYVLRNRVKAGWGDGTWLSAIALSVSPSLVDPPGRTQMRADDRLLQLIIRDIDDIYLGQDRSDDSTRQVCCGDNPQGKKSTAALYYCMVDRAARPWFVENIVRKSEEHPQVGTVGPVMLFL